MQIQSIHFKQRAKNGLENPTLQKNLNKTIRQFVNNRANAINSFPQFEKSREEAVKLKNSVLDNLDQWLVEFEKNALANGSQVLWAENAEQACKHIVDICQKQGAKKIIKSKSMVSEEIGLNEQLEKNNLPVIETDLGEYVLQLAQEAPSHIVAPMVHMNAQQVSDLFHQHHHSKKTKNIDELIADARRQLRKHFLTADIGITGANFLIAKTGSSLVVENEGNARLTMTLPKTRIVLTGIEKIIPDEKSAALMLSLLPRSATGQHISNYVSFSQKPHRTEDGSGPTQLIFILLDAGRSQLLQQKSRDMLRCIRCGACMNHCPVYENIGGHAYGWVYPGPMGSVLTPYYIGLKQAKHLPFSATMCGSCDSVCPVKIPLTRLLRDLREEVNKSGSDKLAEKIMLKMWAMVATKPALYRLSTKLMRQTLKFKANKENIIKNMTIISWFKDRNMKIEGKPKTFIDWAKKNT